MRADFYGVSPPEDDEEYYLWKISNSTTEKDERLVQVVGDTTYFAIHSPSHSFTLSLRLHKVGDASNKAIVSSSWFTIKKDNWNAWNPYCTYQVVYALSLNSSFLFTAKGAGCQKNLPLKEFLEEEAYGGVNSGYLEVDVVANVKSSGSFDNEISLRKKLHKNTSYATLRVDFLLENPKFPGSNVKIGSGYCTVY